MTPIERYKAQWCRSFLNYPLSISDKDILNLVSGTGIEKEFYIFFKRKKAVFELKKALIDALPKWCIGFFNKIKEKDK